MSRRCAGESSLVRWALRAVSWPSPSGSPRVQIAVQKGDARFGAKCDTAKKEFCVPGNCLCGPRPTNLQSRPGRKANIPRSLERMADAGSVTGWVGDLQRGDPAAADLLWERYFRRLQGLARQRLPAALRRAGGGEEVAWDAFASLWRGVEKGQFPELASREHLWRLLVVITTRKAYRLARTESRERASPGQDWALEQVLTREPDPGFEVQAVEECQRLMEMLRDRRLETIARWRLEGLTVREIAARLECIPRTVDRKLELIQTLWAEEVES